MANQLDLSGKLIIKAQLGDDIRRIPIHNEDITYDELVLMMERVFRGKVNSTDELVIKYKDEDKDLITIFDSSDLSFAIQCSRILKLTLFVNGQPRPLEGDQLKHIKQELRHVRDRVNYLLDNLQLEQCPKLQVPLEESSSASQESSSHRATPVKAVLASANQPLQQAPVTGATTSKEFDPLSSQKSLEHTQNKVMSSFGISNDVGAAHPGSPHQPQAGYQAGAPHSQMNPAQQPTQPPAVSAQQQYNPGTPGEAAGEAAASNPPAAQSLAMPVTSEKPQQTYNMQAGYPQQYTNTTGTPQGYAQSGQQQQGSYSQSNPPPTSFNQPQPGATQRPVNQYPGQGQTMYTPTSQYQQFPGNYSNPAPQPQQSTGSPGPQQPGGANPYSRGPSYGQYPRPQGQYPQGPPAPQGYQQ